METMIGKNLFVKEPIRHHGSIPVFSYANEYTANYEKISEDHLVSLRRTGTNPFIPEALWVEFENSTIDLIKKYSKPGDRVLDVGVGLGRVISHFPNLERYGMDISFGYLEIAQSKGINVCYAMVEDMPYREGMFDLVVCTDVLEHVLELNLCCAKILSVLKKGGILIVRVPFREILGPYLRVTYPYQYVHLRNFDEFSLRLLFGRIFGCEFVEAVRTGFAPDKHKLKYRTPLRGLNVLLCRLVSIIGIYYKPLYESFVRKLFDPIEINVVFKK